MLAVRSVLFALLPGTVVVAIPQWLVYRSQDRVSESFVVRAAAIASIAAGTAVLFLCIRDFARKGRGTLAPIDPPTRLVIQGLYRHVRNPMYLGALLVLAGQAFLFTSSSLLWYLLAWFAGVHGFVVLYEEPILRRSFGMEYERYCASVRRWVPRVSRP